MVRFIFVASLVSLSCANANPPNVNVDKVDQVEPPSCPPNSFYSFWTCLSPVSNNMSCYQPCIPIFHPGCMCAPGYTLDATHNCVPIPLCPHLESDHQQSSSGETVLPLESKPVKVDLPQEVELKVGGAGQEPLQSREIAAGTDEPTTDQQPSLITDRLYHPEDDLHALLSNALRPDDVMMRKREYRSHAKQQHPLNILKILDDESQKREVTDSNIHEDHQIVEAPVADVEALPAEDDEVMEEGKSCVLKFPNGWLCGLTSKQLSQLMGWDHNYLKQFQSKYEHELPTLEK
ncbi:uncharacterized protein LOC135159942 [Diachasmimorpha longicaudata]|uniref:uncharacterized protein LOC135159942 n=1 Tax=Diachasmimorpha longicaudata TaxID=58733 RepID=UPI0030B8BF4D